MGEEDPRQLPYFGPWTNPDATLKQSLAQKDDLLAGRRPTPTAPAALTVKELCNAFLDHKADLRDAGELSPRMWAQYHETCALIMAEFGKNRLVVDLRPDDFAALRRQRAVRWSPLTLGNFIQRVRIVFQYAADNDLIDRPVRYGQGFERPSKKTLRLERVRQGAKLFAAEEIRKLMAAARPQVKAMILLGINAGLGNADGGRLPQDALDLAAGWLDYPRPETGMPRRCPLWPETVQALREALEN